MVLCPPWWTGLIAAYLFISTSCEGITQGFSEHWHYRLCLLNVSFFIHAIISGWQGDNAGWAVVLFNRAELVIKKWDLSEASVPFHQTRCKKGDNECWNILLHLSTHSKLQWWGLDQQLSHNPNYHTWEIQLRIYLVMTAARLQSY